MVRNMAGDRLKHLRELRNYTQEYMAEMLKVDQTTYGRWEKDPERNLPRLRRVVEILGVPLHDVLDPVQVDPHAVAPSPTPIDTQVMERFLAHINERAARIEELLSKAVQRSEGGSE